MKTNFIGAVILFGMTLALDPFSATADALDNWTIIQVSPRNFALRSVTYGNGRYVAVGSIPDSDFGRIETSEDGVHWTSRVYPQTPDTFIFRLNKVTYGNGKFVAAGPSMYDVSPNLYCSTNGIDWPGEAQARGPVDEVVDVTYGNGLFVAVGSYNSFGGTVFDHNICTSPDGINWTPQDSGAPTNAFNSIGSIAFGAGRFVAVGVGGYFYTSTFGTNWNRTYVGGAGVNFCKGLFVSSFGSASNLISTDGLNWSVSTNLYLRGAIYANGTYFSIWNQNVFTSTDGTNWVERNLNLPSTIGAASIAVSHSNVVVVGTERTNFSNPYDFHPKAIVSDPFVAVSMESGSPPQLKVSGLNGRSYRIDYAENLFGLTNNWQPLMTRTLTNSPSMWTDTTATNAQRFYRAVLLP
jgi:hypothetical protein